MIGAAAPHQRKRGVHALGFTTLLLRPTGGEAIGRIVTATDCEELFQRALAASVAVRDRSGIFARGEFIAHFRGMQAPQFDAPQSVSVALSVGGGGHTHRKPRPLRERRRHLGDALALHRHQLRAARLEADGLHLLLSTTEQRAERTERRRHHAGDQVADRLPDQVPVAELGITHVSAHRHGEVDAPLRIAEQCNRKIERQTHRILALHGFAQLEVLQYHLVLAEELLVIDLVLQREIQIASLDGAPREGGAVGRKRRERDVAERDLDVREMRRIEGRELAVYVRLAVLADSSAEGERGAAVGIR